MSLPLQLGHSTQFSKVQFPIIGIDIHVVDVLMSLVRILVSPSDPKESLTVLVPSLQIEEAGRFFHSARAVDFATFSSLSS